MSISKTFRITEESAIALEELVNAGRAPTQTALIERLIRFEKLRLDLEREEQELEEEWREAMADPAFQDDLHQVEADFAEIDLDSWNRI